jgi:hypothetical protein
VTLGVEDEWLAVRTADSGDSDGSSLLMTELVAAMGGETVQGAFGFRVPTLVAVRRREGR